MMTYDGGDSSHERVTLLRHTPRASRFAAFIRYATLIDTPYVVDATLIATDDAMLNIIRVLAADDALQPLFTLLSTLLVTLSRRRRYMPRCFARHCRCGCRGHACYVACLPCDH